MKIPYSTTRALRQSTLKRQKIQVLSESDIEDSADESFNKSCDSSVLNDSMMSACSTRGGDYWMKRALEAEAQLEIEKKGREEDNKRWKAKWQPIEDFLKVGKLSTRGSSGQCRVFGKALHGFLIDAAADGIAMSDCRKVLLSLSRFLPLTDDSEDRRVPELDFFQKVRTGKLPKMVELQRSHWIESATKVILTVDATNLNGSNHVAIGGFDENCQFMCLNIKEIGGKTGEQIASVMFSMINEIPGLEDKISVILTDRARNQELANKLLCNYLNRNRCDGYKVFCVCCTMHTVSRIDARTFQKLSKQAMNAAELLMRIFGNRKSFGFKLACLKQALIDELKGNPGFESDLGSRYHCHFANGRALLKYEEEVLKVLNANNCNQNHAKLIGLMESNEWYQIRMELSVPVIVWVVLAGPFHSKISGELNYGELKAEFTDALAVVKKVLKSRNPFKVAYDIAWEIQRAIVGDTKDALERVGEYWNDLDPNLKVEINRVIKAAFEEGRQKLESDWAVLGDLPIEDNVTLVWNNRRIESTFGFLKQVERKSFHLFVSQIVTYVHLMSQL